MVRYVWSINVVPRFRRHQNESGDHHGSSKFALCNGYTSATFVTVVRSGTLVVRARHSSMASIQVRCMRASHVVCSDPHRVDHVGVRTDPSGPVHPTLLCRHLWSTRRAFPHSTPRAFFPRMIFPEECVCGSSRMCTDDRDPSVCMPVCVCVATGRDSIDRYMRSRVPFPSSVYHHHHAHRTNEFVCVCVDAAHRARARRAQ